MNITAEAYDPSLLKRKEYWDLEIALWDHVPPGVTPVKKRYMEDITNPDPAFYHSHHFSFANPPSRQDFITMALLLPWAATAYAKAINEYLPLSQWPMIDSGLKGADVKLFNDEKRHVGDMSVWRSELYVNAPYASVDLFPHQLNRVLKSKIEGYGNLTREMLIKHVVDSHVGVDVKEQERIIRRFVLPLIDCEKPKIKLKG